jgi:CubicO group peptidase (beta-lactamase class C family)
MRKEYRTTHRNKKKKSKIIYVAGFALLFGSSAFAGNFWYGSTHKVDATEAINAAKKATTDTSAEIKRPADDKKNNEAKEKVENKLKEKNEPATLDATVQKNLTKDFISHTPLALNLNQELINNKFSGTALIIKDDKILLNTGYGLKDVKSNKKNDANTLYCVGSMQKAITAAMIGQAVNEKKLEFNTQLSQVAPSVTQKAQTNTISNLLTMTSDLRAPKDKYAKGTQKQIAENYTKNAQYVLYKGWSYQDINYKVLANILMNLYGKSYSDLLTEKINRPYDLKFIPIDQAHKSDDYAKPFDTEKNEEEVYNADSYNTEIGTGNYTSTAGNFYWFIHELVTHKMLPENVLSTLWGTYENESYASGIYHYQNYEYMHGVKGGFEPTMYCTPDGKTSVWLFSNHYSKDRKNVNLSTDIFQQVCKEQ